MVVGGGPGGYEAAVVAAELGAEVVVVDRDGIGGSCVLTDCVPSKTLIATSDVLTGLGSAGTLGVSAPVVVEVDNLTVTNRVKRLAMSQSLDIALSLKSAGVTMVQGSARLTDPHTIEIRRHSPDVQPGPVETLGADVVLLATGASPRMLAGSEPDGERILDWRQLYDLPELPEHLIVVGSGVTGAEFASAYRALGSEVTLVSSRDRVLPGEDSDASAVIEDVFQRRGVELLEKSRSASVSRTADGGVRVTLTDGREVFGSHCLMAVGSVPQTAGLGLAAAGIATGTGGFVKVDRVSRTNVPGVYAAGDCTGVLMLASVAAMQGRIAMWHALGEAVAPLRLGTVASNVFTDPEIATVGVTEKQVESGQVAAKVVKLALSRNARAKMQGLTDGFVKIFARPGSGTVLGAVVVAPRASELILPLSIAVQNGLHAEQLAYTFSVYPSLSGSLTEAARQLMAKV